MKGGSKLNLLDTPKFRVIFLALTDYLRIALMVIESAFSFEALPVPSARELASVSGRPRPAADMYGRLLRPHKPDMPSGMHQCRRFWLMDCRTRISETGKLDVGHL